MASNVHIRPMKKGDIAKLVVIFSFPWSTAEATRELWQRYYQEQKENVRTVAVLEKGKELIGYGSLLRQSEYPHFSNIPEINALWIGDNHRGYGLGTKLIGYLEELARKEGYKEVGIGVGLYKDYGPAQRLYFKLGYSPDGEGVTYKSQPTIPGMSYPLDDDFILWMKKSL